MLGGRFATFRLRVPSLKQVLDMALRGLAPLSGRTLTGAARRRAGAADFGLPAPEPALDVLLRAYEQDTELTAIGRLAARGDVVSLLANRLRLEADRVQFAGIAAEPIAAPIVVTGLPRTGTTLLHALLAQDPGHRAPLAWEVMFPSPPPGPSSPESRQQRYRRAAARLAWMERLSPGFQAVHEIGAGLPQECIAITAHSFVSLRFLVTHDLPSYAAFLESTDHRPAYAFHRRFLQQLQWQAEPRRWVLKAPGHLGHLDALLAIYPDALVVQMHRDPLESIPSLISLRARLRRAFSRSVDVDRIADEVIGYWSEALDRAAVARAGYPARQFFDLDYSSLVERPLDTVAALYHHFGIELSEPARSLMRDYLAANPQHKHGRHRYEVGNAELSAARLEPLRRRCLEAAP